MVKEKKLRYCKLEKVEQMFVLGNGGDWICTNCRFADSSFDLNEIEEYKRNVCKGCGMRYSCEDLDGDLIDESVVTCGGKR